MSVTYGEFACAFGIGASHESDRHVWGTVRSVNTDGSYQVRLNASAMDTRCAGACSAVAGDRVLVCVMADGRAAAVARCGGDIPAVGTSGIWNFVKFSNGLAICWCKATTFNSGTWERWNSMSWYSANSWQANYPFSFIEIPFEKVEMTADSMAIHGFQSSSTQNASNTKTSIYKPMREGTASACTITVRCLAVGRWK